MNQSEQNRKQSQEQSALGEVIQTNVAGVTFEGRQSVVACLQIGEPIILTREPDNRFDANAIRVERKDSAQIGYIPRHLAYRIAPVMDRYDCSIEGVVYLLTGSSGQGYSLGVVIRFQLP